MLGKLQFYGAISIGLIFVTLLLLDFRKPIEKRNRPQEYSFLVIAGILASCFGVAIDSVLPGFRLNTSFTVKELRPTNSFNKALHGLASKQDFLRVLGQPDCYWFLIHFRERR